MNEQEINTGSQGTGAMLTGQALPYVVLHHTGIGAEGEPDQGSTDHFDLMLDVSEAHKLWTWRVMRPPGSWAASGGDIGATRLPDHRRAYLDYEGPISGGRGEVRRIARGVAHVEESAKEGLVLRLEGPITAKIHLPQ